LTDSHFKKQSFPADSDAFIDCKLFSDKVSERLCLLRKKELHLKGEFSCEGCARDVSVSRQPQRVKRPLEMRTKQTAD
jgi:hypothetical protein